MSLLKSLTKGAGEYVFLGVLRFKGCFDIEIWFGEIGVLCCLWGDGRECIVSERLDMG